MWICLIYGFLYYTAVAIVLVVFFGKRYVDVDCALFILDVEMLFKNLLVMNDLFYSLS